MSAKILMFNGVTRLDLPPDRLLTRAKGRLTEVVILGYDKEGEFFFASSKADGGDVLWLLEMSKKRLLEIGGA